MKNTHIINLTSVTEIYGTGQKTVSVMLEYDTPLSEKALSPTYFRVEGRTVADIAVSDSYRGSAKEEGRFVELVVDSDDDNSSTKKTIGTGHHSRTEIIRTGLTVSQTVPLESVTEIELPPFFQMETTHTDNGIADCFTVHKFQVPGSDRELGYNLYIPKNSVPGQKLPLVLFMHDAGSCSDDVSAAIVQGSGAVVWARDAEAGKRPCYILAPHYPEVCANDDYEVTWQADATVSLIKNLTERFPIDKARIYGTGQSMGCMMLCEMLLRNPCFFAGSLLVAGQWNPGRMQGAKDASIWAVVSAGDKKAFPIMGECFANMEKAGGKLAKGHIDAKADMSVIDGAIRKQKSLGCNLNFTWFEGKSILPANTPDHPGMHHISTWVKAYDIESLREWLFEQRINGQCQTSDQTRKDRL